MSQLINGTSTDDDVYGEVADGIGTITLNRPDRRNALSDAMVAGLETLLDAMQDSEDVGVIVITGAGKAFCSGGDVQDFDAKGGEGGGSSEVDVEAVEAQRQAQRATVGKIYRSRKPVIAAIPGAAAGAGLGLALAADFRIGSERAVFATAFGAVGLSGDFGVAWLLNDIVGPVKARELMLLNPRVRAEEARSLGLLNEVVPEDEFDARVRALAEQLANGPAQAYEYMLDNLDRAPRVSLEESMDAEVPLHKATGLTEDHIGAVRAFVEKRTPVFGRRAATAGGDR
ncbi:enoyl-CoA hydratase/isomerase family protein [Aeromicrobium sp. Marseille-Q0843]|uniref:Enoyl-CoA hydratase/isomerase family protein n=1 Tax=Aeromicrobium phoceense TaxID=2754045 RepID=A0A838XM34_9ACTN|nr:enoyl-CoA hydratase-related protein [Aeromicrobium phoceense]MBA4608023.1 enoyl-CoA hydratase/isomerase family protein [Aeromicrobium phoceense]